MGSYKILIVIVSLMLVTTGIWFYYDFSSELREAESSDQEESYDSDSSDSHVLSKRKKELLISGGEGRPVFEKKLIIDPAYQVDLGERQYFSIWAKDPEGIERVTVTIKKSEGEEAVEAVDLNLVEGTRGEGRWAGSWTVKEVSLGKKRYLVDFQAFNKQGTTTKITSSWVSKD